MCLCVVTSDTTAWPYSGTFHTHTHAGDNKCANVKNDLGEPVGLSSFSLAIRSVKTRACGRQGAVDVGRGGWCAGIQRGRREREQLDLPTMKWVFVIT